eukprot:4479599-Karenia_brevis.AAC.1
MALSIDGTVLTVPPNDPTDRHNHCHHLASHMWRKKSERASPELAGHDPFSGQIPLGRALPLWGGIAVGGYSNLAYHKSKKMTVEEWIN